MNIKKFSEINENVRIPTLDVLIDNDGNIYNNKFGRPLMKGNIVLKKSTIEEYVRNFKRNVIVDIIGIDGKSYPGGIDKNGQLVGVNIIDGVLYTNYPEGENFPIKIPKKLVSQFGENWEDNIDYIKLIPILPTGWVNVKIDMEVLKRVRRYSASLGNNKSGVKSLIGKIEDLERISSGLQLRRRARETIQKEMSAIILLHYINEIKDFFTPGSSGFLFESFIAGMIPNAKVVEDNSEADIIADNVKYQIKLCSGISSTVPISNAEVNFYLIALKYSDKIDIYLLSNDFRRNNYYKKFEIKSGISVSKLKLGKVPKYTLELINIESKIETISKGLKDSLHYLFNELSEFQYNIETIISGVNQEGEIIDGLGFKNISSKSHDNVKNMRRYLTSLIENIDIKFNNI
jgi:hypothetical protein